ncbi:MAG: MBOAT family O-acyltransferase [Spirochaetales bacterium]|nr:MBOAT family O-acyltransferase [Spirochaetales bacterium]
MKIFAWGFLKKFIVADSISVYVNSVYSAPVQMHGCAVLLATLFYSFQIHFDFSGYSDMAIGISRFLGFDIGKNFDHPYLSKGCSEFWRRWHISLSSWLRDYIYIPLGGSRCALPRICLNLILTFLASGIWHGASFGFVIWGVLHGLYVCLERIFRNQLEKIPYCLRIFGTFLLVSFAWIFFRAENVHDSFVLIKKLFQIPSEISRTFPALTASFGIKESVRRLFALSDEVKGLTGIIFIFLKILPVAEIEFFTYKKSGLEIIRSQKAAVRWFLYSVFVIYVLLNIPQSRSTSFLYFNF